MSFNVIIYDFNRKKFIPYDILPYFTGEYKGMKKKDRPVTKEQFTEFVKSKGMYRFWSRCEYEMILSDWPPSGVSEKWDVWRQIEMNLDTIVDLLMLIVKTQK